MRYIADWHIHSKYSRACSKDLELPKIAEWCERKGVHIVATGDWMHPKWFKHLEESLVEERKGIYRLRTSTSSVYKEARPTEFMLITEVSQIYKKGDKTRRVHNLIWSPSLETCRKVNGELTRLGFNLKSDGRPILGIDSEELYKLFRSIDDRIIVIPAHAWTPWYAIFGSKSGFDSIEECFGSMAKYVYAIETGLSSDPRMNWQLSQLENISFISNSDAHSPRNLAREANVFEFDEPPTYDDFVQVLKDQDKKHFTHTIEFYPEEGKYHADGCAACGFSCEPDESKKLGERCPKCKKKLTLGVQYRVSMLADKKVGEMNPIKIPFRSIVPLQELLAQEYGVKSSSSKKVLNEYNYLTDEVDELTLLVDTPIDLIRKISNAPGLADAIEAMREGCVNKQPGYDGVFGKITVIKK